MNRPLHYLTIGEMAQAMRRRELSAEELTRHHLERIAALDPGLGALCAVYPEPALRAAREADRRLAANGSESPLCGVPFVAKDLFDVQGQPTMAGCSLLRDNLAARDASVVARLRAAGMVLLGKSHTVQFAYGGLGVNHDQGTPRNPWGREHLIPGGSSSGSAVAVAAGLAPLGLGTDTGGSVRIPAALCATVGLKTTVGQVSRAGVYPLSGSLDSVGPLTRGVEDAAQVYACMAGRDPLDESTNAWRAQTPAPESAGGLRGLRLAFAETVFWEDAHPEVAAAVRATANVLRDLGALVDSVAFEHAEAARNLNPRGLVIAAEAYANNRRLLEQHFAALDPVVAQRMVLGRDVSARDYLATVHAWQKLRMQACAALDGIDALLVPTTPQPARALALVDASEQAYADNNVLYLRNTSIGNILNLCAVSVPCGFTSAGLPVGLMVYARPFQEALALRVAAAYEAAAGWQRRHPPPG